MSIKIGRTVYATMAIGAYSVHTKEEKVNEVSPVHRVRESVMKPENIIELPLEKQQKKNPRVPKSEILLRKGKVDFNA
tara:strand:- start:353 stop:586 length:234 start_codon:yes stop_codon:yes gene_type:complete